MSQRSGVVLVLPGGLRVGCKPVALTYQFDGWRLDTGRRRLVSPHGLPVMLTAGQYDLLVFLCEHPQRPVVPPGTQDGVRVRVNRLRGVLNPFRPLDDRLIQTVRNKGYYFTPEVVIVDTAA